jgi:hypothetical protein
MKQNPDLQFPHDQDNRILTLYFDVNIHTISNRTKLKNIKKKFCKYLNYVTKYEKNNVIPQILEYQKIQDDAYLRWQEAKTTTLTCKITPVNAEKRLVFFRMFSIAQEKCEQTKCVAFGFTLTIEYILNKINEITKHIYKNYKKCSQCEKKGMVTNCACKSNHKLCSECSDDITECPVCEEDLGLQYCAICMENKKEIVETGCENKHQTCKECLDKIIGKNNLCPFCRHCCSKEPVDPQPSSYYLMHNGEDIRDYLQDMADDMRERDW